MNIAGGSHHIWDLTAFWPAAGIIVGLLAIVATVWVTLRAANPKRRLLYSMPVCTSMLNRQSELPELKVIYGAKQLESPHVVNVELASRGRTDIPRNAFDGGKPLRLDVGAPIVECLQVTMTPPDRPEPACAIDGSKLLIGPSLIGRRQTTVFSLLVDGAEPRLSPPEQSLVDVDLRRGSSSEPFILRERPIPVVVMLLILVAGALLASQAPQHGAVVVIAAVCLGLACAILAWITRPWRR
jgi:hypothetical protein